MTLIPPRTPLVRRFLLLALAGSLAVGCTARPAGDEGDPDVTPQQREQLDHALSLCEPVVAHVEACEPDDDVPFVAAVGDCVAIVGEAGADAPACTSAIEDYLGCLSELDCDDLVGGSVDANPGSSAEPEPEPGDGDAPPSDGAGEGDSVEVHAPCEALADAVDDHCTFFALGEEHTDGGADPDAPTGG